MQHRHVPSPVALAQQTRVLEGEGLEQLPLADQLGQLCDPHIEVDHLVPGRLAHHTVRRQAEDALEGSDRLLRLWIIDTGDRPDLRDGRIALGDAVEHRLHHHHILPLGAQTEGRARIGAAQILNGGILYQLDVLPVVIPQDLHRPIALLGQVLAAPLGEAVAGAGGAVAELGRQGLYKVSAADVVVKSLIHRPADVLKDVPAADELLVVGGGGGDVEVIAPAGVELCVDPVQGKGDDGQDIGLDGRRLPGGVDLTGGHIFHIVREADRDVFRLLIRQAQVYGNRTGHNRRHADGHSSPHRLCPGISQVWFWIRLDSPSLRGASSIS